jgi:hypothetical protein
MYKISWWICSRILCLSEASAIYLRGFLLLLILGLDLLVCLVVVLVSDSDAGAGADSGLVLILGPACLCPFVEPVVDGMNNKVTNE